MCIYGCELSKPHDERGQPSDVLWRIVWFWFAQIFTFLPVLMFWFSHSCTLLCGVHQVSQLCRENAEPFQIFACWHAGAAHSPDYWAQVLSLIIIFQSTLFPKPLGSEIYFFFFFAPIVTFRSYLHDRCWITSNYLSSYIWMQPGVNDLCAVILCIPHLSSLKRAVRSASS